VAWGAVAHRGLHKLPTELGLHKLSSELTVGAARKFPKMCSIGMFGSKYTQCSSELVDFVAPENLVANGHLKLFWLTIVSAAARNFSRDSSAGHVGSKCSSELTFELVWTNDRFCSGQEFLQRQLYGPFW